MNDVAKKGCLAFIFNADSGAINSVKDFFHKMVKPSTYECNLCAVTFSNFGMKKDWAQYISSIEDQIAVEFLHKDEFEELYPEANDPKYPSAYYWDEKDVHVFISQDEMNAVKSVDELKKMVNERLEEIEDV
ncbi:MAG: hypothetical protein EU521_02020 [Promethearchaeota archaeon]|nr:MAG: hypothetical protein EU521_02020 [Candidatus Lokiarchaeota archaeon]